MQEYHSFCFTYLAVSGLLCKIKSMMVHHVHKALQGWHIQLSVGTCSHRKKDFHKHESKSMLYFLVPGVYKHGSTFLKQTTKLLNFHDDIFGPKLRRKLTVNRKN